MASWQEYMKARIEGNEKYIPWFLRDKIACNEWCARLDVPTPRILGVFEHPSLISVPTNEDSFVLKPTKFSSTRGVMVLERQGQTYFDCMTKRNFSSEEIIAHQSQLAERFSVRGNRWITEERVVDNEGYDLPLDFKAYAFRGRVELFLVIDRSTRPTSVAWFDSNLVPVGSRDISLNPKYVQKLEGLSAEKYTDLMELSSSISALVNTPFARVDLYNSIRGPLLGEVTLTPGGLYYGDHYKMSKSMDQLMGACWSQAAIDLAEKRDCLSQVAYQKCFTECKSSERASILHVMNRPSLLAQALEYASEFVG